MLQAFGGADQKAPKAPKAAMRKWFKEEKLDGYVKPVNKITTTSILSLSTSLQSLAKQVSSTGIKTAERYGEASKGKLKEWMG